MNIDLIVLMLTLESSPLIFIYREIWSTTSAPVVILSLISGVMVIASGLLPDSVLLISTSLKVATTNCAKIRQILIVSTTWRQFS